MTCLKFLEKSHFYKQETDQLLIAKNRMNYVLL